jgi:hypothetical protein
MQGQRYDNVVPLRDRTGTYLYEIFLLMLINLTRLFGMILVQTSCDKFQKNNGIRTLPSRPGR